MNKKDQESLEKIKEIDYIRLNFKNKLRFLTLKQNQIIKKLIGKLDSQNLKKVREQINIYE